MKITTRFCTIALLATAYAVPAAAQDAAAATEVAAAPEAPASDFTINGGATLVSDYRFRGISQTDKSLAVQGTMSVSHSSGFYATVWGSSIDDYVAGFSDQEIDFIVGYKKTFGSTTIDGGVLYYYYPGAEEIFPGYDSDFFEPYISVAHSFGAVTAKVSAAYAPEQNALSIGSGKEDNLYLAGDLSGAIPGVPLALTAHLGHSFGPSYLTIGKGYTDWSLGAAYTWKALTFGLSYVDTNKSLYSPITGHNISKAGVVASVGVAF
ncbi:MAG: TorF family putative porin [Sphingomicrobium sp.]